VAFWHAFGEFLPGLGGLLALFGTFGAHFDAFWWRFLALFGTFGAFWRFLALFGAFCRFLSLFGAFWRFLAALFGWATGMGLGVLLVGLLLDFWRAFTEPFRKQTP
jgi:hypothetical protein